LEDFTLLVRALDGAEGAKHENAKSPRCISDVRAAKPLARKERTPLSLTTPFQRFTIDFISPKARFESRSSRIFFLSSGSFGSVSFQLLAERSVKRLAASGASRDSIDFFLSSFRSLLICDEVMVWRLRIIALFRSLSSPEDDRLLRRLVLLRPPLLRFLLRFLGLRLPDLLLLGELSEL
jgi:hypothetical protein